MSELMKNSQMTAEGWDARFGDFGGFSDHDAQPEINDPLHGLEFPCDISLETNPNDLIDGVIGPGDLAVVYGASGVGKTFIVLHIALRLALDLIIAGKETRPAAVLYVGYEGERGLKKRLLAAVRKHGDPGRRFARLTLNAPLDSSANGVVGVAEICKAVERLKAASGCADIVVIVDTLSRAIAGDDENAAQSLSAFVERRAGEITRRTGAAIICVHHSGKDESKGMRGSSALFAACDGVIAVTDGKVGIEKAKDAETGPWFSFSLEPAALGEDDRGKPITSCVVAERDAPPAKSASKSQPKGATAEAYQILQRIYDQRRHSDVSAGEVGILDAEPNERWRVIELEDWKAACREACLTVPPDDDTPKAASKREWAAFNRAVDSLAGTYNLVGRHGKYVWLTSANQKRTGRSSSTVLHSSTSVEPVEPDEAAGSSTRSTPPYRGVERVEPDVPNPVVSRQEERGRKNGSNQEGSVPPQPNGYAGRQSSSFPREPIPPNQRPSDHARSMGSTGAQADVGPVAPGNNNDEPPPGLAGRIEI